MRVIGTMNFEDARLAARLGPQKTGGEDAVMIFKQFLYHESGCAAYVFG